MNSPFQAVVERYNIIAATFGSFTEQADIEDMGISRCIISSS
ncbi:MAG: hypothetical protein ACJAYG_002238 [Oceanicoccus sp.]|jgi:hypothetical protein